MAPDGMLLVSSATHPFVYKVRPGSFTAERFIDARAEGQGTFFFGVLADASSKILWTCQLTPVPEATLARLHSALRGFDLSTGAPKLRWNLPGDNSMCNDFTTGPDRALYITDTANGRIYRLTAGASSAELFLEHPALVGVDGITFLDGSLYVNNLFSSKLYRIPIDAVGNAQQPVDISLDQPLKGPDGMRAAKGKLIVAENGSGRVSAITVKGDRASVVVLKGGLKTPTAVEPAGDKIWIAERGTGRTLLIPMPN
jgi:sugar lactone lactonase YvrE